MRTIRHLIIICVLAAAAAACTKPAALTLLSNQVAFEAAAGQQEISFLTNRDWTFRSDADWVSVTPASGGPSDSYQRVTVSVSANEAEAERTASLTLAAGELSRVIGVRQAGKPVVVPPKFTIRDFRNRPVSTTEWYELTGEIVSLPEEHYGNFFMADETGYIYVYGLCEKQVEKNDQSFSKLGLKPGDKVTIKTLRSEYNKAAQAGGNIPAYFVSRQAGTYRLGRKVASTSAKWMELPATKADDGQDLLIHSTLDGKRSYAAYFDYDHFVSSWVAYPLHSGNIGSGKRMEESAFPMDPLLDRSQQAYLPKGYKESSLGKKYDRGHQIPSADRLDWRLNIETFFSTNMTPQDSELNAKAWEKLEEKVRGWACNADTDTLYVVTGCYVGDSTETAEDSDGKKITVPRGYYKALLRLSKKDNSYSSVAFWFDNKSNSASSIQKTMSMSVDELEKKVSVDFFVNLPADTQKSVEAQNPADVAWWWNN